MEIKEAYDILEIARRGESIEIDDLAHGLCQIKRVKNGYRIRLLDRSTPPPQVLVSRDSQRKPGGI